MTEVEKAPEEEADLKERLLGFNSELRPLLGKYELGIGALPKILPNGTLSADPVIVSQRGVKPPEQVAEATPAEEAPALAEG